MSKATESTSPYQAGSRFYILNKLIFVLLVIMHVVMWPSVTTISFAVAYGIISISRFRLLLTEGSNIYKELMAPGIFILESGKSRSIFMTLIVALYFTCYFIGFVSHEGAQQPVSTMWIDPSLMGNYSFVVETGNVAIPSDVTASVSKTMRDNLFTWERSFDFVPHHVTVIRCGMYNQMVT